MALARFRSVRHRLAYCTAYDTVRPSLVAVSKPAFSSRARCRETTEKSTWQQSATSVTEHGRLHLTRQVSSLVRVGSLSALNKLGSSKSSTARQQAAACLGDMGLRVRTCVIMQVLACRRRVSTLAVSSLLPHYPAEVRLRPIVRVFTFATMQCEHCFTARGRCRKPANHRRKKEKVAAHPRTATFRSFSFCKSHFATASLRWAAQSQSSGSRGLLVVAVLAVLFVVFSALAGLLLKQLAEIGVLAPGGLEVEHHVLD